MDSQSDIVGSFLKISKQKITEYQDYQVVIGFSGFGNVGYLALTHLVETLDLESVAFWGHSSWYHKGRIESILTVYQHEKSKTLLIVPRLPIHVSAIDHRYWDMLARDILSWRCKRYIVIGGLREETRDPSSTVWAAYAPTPKWKEKYNQEPTLRDHLAMIGPLSSFITQGSAADLAVLGLLAYCNLDEDPESASMVIKEIDRLCDIEIPSFHPLIGFDFSFIPNLGLPLNNEDADQSIVNDLNYDNDDPDDEDDMPGYDLNELV